MESRKEAKIDLIGIDNSEHARYIVSVTSSMFPDAILIIHEDDYESGVPREDEWSDL